MVRVHQGALSLHATLWHFFAQFHNAGRITCFIGFAAILGIIRVGFLAARFVSNDAMRFRPRFSVRTLAIFVTLVCAYFAAWEATKRYIIPPHSETEDTRVLVAKSDSPAPFVIWRNEAEVPVTPPDVIYMGPGRALRRYYLWLFGLTIKLPIETNWYGNRIKSP